MRNPSSLSIPQSRQITNQINRLVDLNQLQLNNPHNLIDSPGSRDESVEAKWEQIQYYEAKENHSLSSIASSSNSNSTSSTSNSSSSNAKLKSRLKKLKQNSLKKLQSFKLWTKNGKPSKTEEQAGNNEVNSQPNGTTTDPNAGSYSMSTKLRASKSMQNLEQLTRDSFYNLKDISNNLKQRYNSRMELRQQSQMYNELWDDNDSDDDGSDDQDYYHRSHKSYDY